MYKVTLSRSDEDEAPMIDDKGPCPEEAGSFGIDANGKGPERHIG